LPSAHPLRWRKAALAAVGLIALLVVLVRVLPDPAPESDHAFIDLKVVNVVHHLDPTGAYSRFGWRHPGPLYFQLLAPLYFLSGLRHLAILAGVALINLACVIAMLVVLRRYGGGIWLMLSLAVLMGIHFYRASDLLASPWNAHTPLLPLALLIVIAAAIWAGRIWLLPVAVGVASLVIQTHIGPSLAVLAVLAVCLVCVVVPAIRARGAGGRGSSEAIRIVGTAAVVGLVLWALPFADSIAPGGEHNLTQIVTDMSRWTPIAPRVADRAFAYYFIAPFSPELELPWGAPLRAGRDADWRITAQVMAGLLAIALLVALVRKQRFETGLAMMVLVASAAAWYSARRLPEEPLNHTLYWIAPIGVLTWAVVAGTAANLLTNRIVLPARISVILQWSVAVMFVIAGVGSTIIWYQRFVGWSPKVEAATNIVRKRLRAEPGKEPMFEIVQAQWSLPPGVILQLIKDGFHPAVNADRLAMFGPWYARDPHKPYVEFHVVVDPENSDDLIYRTNYTLIGSAEDTFIYTAEPPPQFNVAPPTHLISVAKGIAGGESVVDGRTADTDAAHVAVFETPGAPLAVSTIPGVIGVRFWGQGATDWLLGCVHDDGTTTPTGQVHISVGDGVQFGDTFVKSIASCRAVTVTAPDNNAGTWLSEIQLLTQR